MTFMELAELQQNTKELASFDLASCDDVRGWLLAVLRLQNVAHVLAGRLLVQMHKSGEHFADGATSAPNWAAVRSGANERELWSRMRTADRLQQLPVAEAAAIDGELQPRHQQQLADCVRSFPDLAARDDAVLTQLALELPMKDFDNAIRVWRELAADDRDDNASAGERNAAAAEPSQVWLTEGFAGRWTLTGNLQPDVGAMLNGLLQQGYDRLWRAKRDGDPSLEHHDPSMLRGEVLTELLANAMRSEPGERSVPDRYRVAVVLTPEQLANPPLAACDSALFRLVMSTEREPLELGREVRSHSRSQRRAMGITDEGCIFPGCDRPPSWCDAHHCDPWSEGGETNVSTGTLLCIRHHAFLHTRGLKARRTNGRTRIYNPDGTLFTINRWQLE